MAEARKFVTALRRSGTPILLRSRIGPEACRFGPHTGDFPFHSSTRSMSRVSTSSSRFSSRDQAQSLSFAAVEMVGAPESLLICLRLDEFSKALMIGVNTLLSLLILVLWCIVNCQFIPDCQNGCSFTRFYDVYESRAVQLAFADIFSAIWGSCS